jgi:(S)-2-hydroxyglutarate dehydrogenase
MTTAARFVVIGGGIVGLAVADLLTSARPGSEVTVVEKEQGWATHQTGRNSGVIHSGLYYVPGSKKARMCQAGARSMVRFAEEEGLAHEICGKLVVATSETQLPGLRRLHERGLANGLSVAWLSAAQAREHEPHVRAVAALHVPSTGIIDYGAVCQALVRRLRVGGATMALGSTVVGAAAGWCTRRRGISRRTWSSTAPACTVTSWRAGSAPARPRGSCRSGVSTTA